MDFHKWLLTKVLHHDDSDHQGSDITAIKQLQSSIIDHLPNHYIFWKDRNSVYLGCNTALAAELGYNSPNDIVGKTDYDLPVKKEEADAYRADDKQVMSSKTPKLNIEEPQTLANGKTKILLTTKIPLFDAHDEICGILGIYSDITQQKENEAKLHEMNESLQHSFQVRTDLEKQLQESIIDHLPNHFIFWKDKNSVFLGCNKAFAKGAHLSSSAEIIGKTDYDLPWSKEESDQYIADDQQVMRSKKPKLNIEESQTLSNGKKIILLTSKVPLFNEHGDVYGVLAIYSDVTEQKLNEQKIVEANQKLEKAYQVKSEFIRNISHDIRTPLSGIQQTLKAIAEGKIPEEEVPEFAFAAWEASNKLMELFNQIIDISKKEHFDTEDQIVKFDLQALLQDLNETYKIVAKHKGIKLEFDYPENIPNYLLGKHLRLHRVLMNLLGNALKFTGAGNVRLVIEKAKETDEKIIMRFSVIDTGIGIPKEKHEIIFEPFSRLSPSFQGQYPGSGLGLHVVKDYVEKMQGEIYVESEIGQGSMFTCILPFKRPILNNDNDVIEIEYLQKISNNEIAYLNKPCVTKKTALSDVITNDAEKKYCALLVEDDKLAQSMGVLILKDIGYRVDAVKTGKEALALTEKNQYDIIYMDVGLPDIDGIETTQLIRNNENNLNQHTFVTALTAHADDDISNQCYSAGMQHILLKPLSTEKAQHIHLNFIQNKDYKIDKNIVDFDLWRQRLGNNAHLVDELFHVLVKDLNSTRDEIIQAYESHDLAKLKAITHKMKGGLKYCALPRLEAAIIAIESAAKNNEEHEVEKLYPKTLKALDEATKAYEEWLKYNN